MNTLRWNLILPFTMIAVHALPLMAQQGVTSSGNDPEKKVDLMNLTISGYTDFCKSMIINSEADKGAFAKSSKTMLVGMLGWEKRPDEQRVFDIDPMFNRSLIFCLVACQNKIKLDKQDMENFKNDCAKTAIKAGNEETKMIIAKIYGLILAMNEKLPERAAP